MRYTIVHDDYGHQYLIEADEMARFKDWVESGSETEYTVSRYDYWRSEYSYFNQKRFEGGVLTFTDPELDGKKMV